MKANVRCFRFSYEDYSLNASQIAQMSCTILKVCLDTISIGTLQTSYETSFIHETLLGRAGKKIRFSLISHSNICCMQALRAAIYFILKMVTDNSSRECKEWHTECTDDPGIFAFSIPYPEKLCLTFERSLLQ